MSVLTEGIRVYQIPGTLQITNHIQLVLTAYEIAICVGQSWLNIVILTWFALPPYEFPSLTDLKDIKQLCPTPQS